MGRRAERQGVVRSRQVAAELSAAARREAARDAGGGKLCRPRLLNDSAAARLKAALGDRAHALGFDLCGVTAADAIPEAAERLQTFLDDGHHGTMTWMADTAARRGAPALLWSEVRSVITLAMSYGPEGDPLATLPQRDRATISVYARNHDYHDLMKGRLKELAQGFLSRARDFGVAPEVKVFVDTAPVMEKPLAEAGGLGWLCKHSNLVSRGLGSMFFLGDIFTTLELPPDERERDHCGSCRACLDACTTDAFPAPYRLDARRCISYLTIEH